MEENYKNYNIRGSIDGTFVVDVQDRSQEGALLQLTEIVGELGLTIDEVEVDEINEEEIV